MTTFAVKQAGIDTSRPLELYTFTRGFNVTRYVASDLPTEFDGQDFDPAVIERGVIEDKGQADKTTTVTLLASLPIAQLFFRTPPSQRTEVLIERIEFGQSDTNRRILFVGTIREPTYRGDATKVEFLCQTAEAGIDKQIPLYGFARPCGHTLYGPGCEVNPALHNHEGTVLSVTGQLQLEVDGLAASGIDPRGGWVRTASSDDFRTIRSVSGDVIEINYPFFDDQDGLEVTVQAGCDHIFESDCALVFDNVVRFGGWPYPPLKNPFQTGLD